jgi:hypothetical protein
MNLVLGIFERRGISDKDPTVPPQIREGVQKAD